MATRKGVRSDKALVKKGAPLVKKLQGAKVDAGGGVPGAADEALPQLAVLAADLVKARTNEEQASVETAGVTAQRARVLPCQKYNTYWDAFKSVFGFESEWEACMCRTYGDPWC